MDWLSPNIPHLGRVLEHLVGRPGVAMLEIGSFEGRSTVWFLENVLTGARSTITCIDTFRGSAEHTGVDHDALLERFKRNVAPWSDRVTVLEGESRRMLRTLGDDPRFEAVYVDGSHETPDVLEDAVLSWPLLRDGGVMIFDDYLWRARESRPGPAIDAFLGVFAGRYELLHQEYQVSLRKQRAPRHRD